MKMIHCQKTAWPKVDQETWITHLQTSTNHLTQHQPGWPAQIPQMKGSELTMIHLFQSSRMIRNQPPWRYQNFALWQNAILPSTFKIWVGLCICLHIISCLHIMFMENTVWRHSIWATADLPNTNNSWHQCGYHPCWLYGGFWMQGVDQRIFGPSAAAPLEKPKKDNPITDPVGVLESTTMKTMYTVE